MLLVNSYVPFRHRYTAPASCSARATHPLSLEHWTIPGEQLVEKMYNNPPLIRTAFGCGGYRAGHAPRMNTTVAMKTLDINTEVSATKLTVLAPYHPSNLRYVRITIPPPIRGPIRYKSSLFNCGLKSIASRRKTSARPWALDFPPCPIYNELAFWKRRRSGLGRQ